MLYFTIALRSKASTNNWKKTIEDFNNTIASIFNQTSDDFECYVACNDIPEMTKNYGERLHFIVVNTPKPNSWIEWYRDRAWKQLVCSYEIYKRNSAEIESGGIFVFPVDADDYISNRVAAYVAQNSNSYGFKSKTGYKYFKGKRT